MTNIVGITVYGVLYLVVMLLLFMLFFIGRDWLMFTGLSGFNYGTHIVHNRNRI